MHVWTLNETFRMDPVAKPGSVFPVSVHILSGGIIGEESLRQRLKLKRLK